MSKHEFPIPHYINLHQDIGQTPQDHISFDLIVLYNTTSQGNSYALTVVCNFTGYLMTTPIKDKKMATIVIHLFLEIMLKFSFPRILHSDNRTEFKSKLIEHHTQQLGIKKTYISHHHPQANGKLKHHIDSLKTAFGNEHSQESPHFVYFRCDPYLPHLAASYSQN